MFVVVDKIDETHVCALDLKKGAGFNPNRSIGPEWVVFWLTFADAPKK